MRSEFYYDDHYRVVANKVREYLISAPEAVSGLSVESPRAVGDTIEELISQQFDNFLGDWCGEYSSDFSRRAMADLAFTDTQGVYSIVDVKTHRQDTAFNMPNLTSVERLSRFYESDENTFSLLMVKYLVEDSKIVISDVLFTPIEFLDWNCLTIGALGWGQIQIANSNQIQINEGYSRKKWMLELCDILLNFYPKEISKTQQRITHFEDIRTSWENHEDIWA